MEQWLIGNGFTSRYSSNPQQVFKDPLGRCKATTPSSLSLTGLIVPALKAQWLCHQLVGWEVLGSHLSTGSKPEQVFKGPVGRCKATTPSSLSITSNRVNSAGPDGAVDVSSASGLVGTGFTSRYRLQPTAGF